jgi:hypothetical protein
MSNNIELPEWGTANNYESEIKINSVVYLTSSDSITLYDDTDGYKTENIIYLSEDDEIGSSYIVDDIVTLNYKTSNDIDIEEKLLILKNYKKPSYKLKHVKYSDIFLVSRNDNNSFNSTNHIRDESLSRRGDSFLDKLKLTVRPGIREPLLKLNIPLTLIDGDLKQTNQDNIDELYKLVLGKQIEPNKVDTNSLISKAVKLNKTIKLVWSDTKQFIPEIVKRKEKLNVNRGDKKPNEEKKKKTLQSTKMLMDKWIQENPPNETLLSEYKDYIESSEKIYIKSHYLQNSKQFTKKMSDKLMPLTLLDKSESCLTRGKGGEFKSMPHQLIVKHYLNTTTPYRGLLLFHGLGSGKTCSSIGIIEGMKHNKKVFIMTPASLQKNYRKEMRYCADQLFKLNNRWKIHIIDRKTEKSKLSSYYALTGIPPKTLIKNQRLFLVNEEGIKYEEMDKESQRNLNIQLDLMVKKKYNFINYNGIRMDTFNKTYIINGVNPFSNSVVVIDEAHNFVSRIVNKIKSDKQASDYFKEEDVLSVSNSIGKRKTDSISLLLYDLLMRAENCHIVALSGTPIINYPCELGTLFNIINGYNRCFKIKPLLKGGFKPSQQYFTDLFRENKSIDFIEYDNHNNELKITKNRYGFIKTEDGQVIYDEKGLVYIIDLKKEIMEILEKEIDKYTISKIELEYFKCLPDTEHSFNEYFVTKNNEINNKQYFQSKISGLVSYLGDKEQLMPKLIKDTSKLDRVIIVNTGDKKIKNKLATITDFVDNKYIVSVDGEEDLRDISLDGNNLRSLVSGQSLDKHKDGKPSNIQEMDGEIYHIEEVEMSPFVFEAYGKIRKLENKMDMKKKKTSKNKDTCVSSYRVFSRAVCNFAFSQEDSKDTIKRPMPGGKSLEQTISSKIDETKFDDITELEKIDDGEGRFDDKDTNLEDRTNTKNESTYSKEIESALSFLTENPEKFFENKNVKYLTREQEGNAAALTNTLEMYSPKFNKILENIVNEDNRGCHLLYSNFRRLEGIGIFRILLQYQGFRELQVLKGPTGEYMITITNNVYSKETEFTEDSPIFALYTGTENDEQREIIRNIYNSNWEQLSSSLRSQVETLFPELSTSNEEDGIARRNIYGEVIKLLMITSSGAEGIDLKNTKYVHIMEPYWHYVRVNQVIGRARRICSHVLLPDDEQIVKVFMYVMKYSDTMLETKDQNPGLLKILNQDVDDMSSTPITTDEKLLMIMKNKYKLLGQFLESLKESSIDCVLNHEDPTKCVINFPYMETGLYYKENKLGEVYAPERVKGGKKVKRTIPYYDRLNNKQMKKLIVDESTIPKKAYDYDQHSQTKKLTQIGIVVEEGGEEIFKAFEVKNKKENTDVPIQRVDELVKKGYDREKAIKALNNTNGNIGLATQLLKDSEK